jgi:hypothetical protein
LQSQYQKLNNFLANNGINIWILISIQNKLYFYPQYK